MSNHALQQKLSGYESRLREAQRITNQLEGELSVVANGANRAERELEAFNTKIRNCLDESDGRMQSSHGKIIDAIALQGEIEQLYVRFKNIELANKKIRACNNKKYYDFGNYRTIRKIVQGMMDNLEMNLVSDQMILKSVEVKHLQTPDYWLTCVLISIMAWRDDDKELADRAMAQALSLDKKESAVFYMLFNLRMARDDAAIKWFYTYQECELKGSDKSDFLVLFSLVSKGMTGSVNERLKNDIFVFINKIIRDNEKAEGYSEEMVLGRIKRYFLQMEPDEPMKYAMLQKVSPAAGQMQSVLMDAKNNIEILQFILDTVHVSEDVKNAFIKDYIDKMIAAPNQTEKSVYEEIAYNESIIKCDGDVDKARKQNEENKIHNQKALNLINEMIAWIYSRDSKGMNGQIRLNMFTLTKSLQQEAVESYFNDYREREMRTFPIVIDDYSATVDPRQEDAELSKISQFYQDIRDKNFSAIKNWKAYFSFGVGIAAAAAAFLVGPWLFALTAVGIGFGLLLLFFNRSRRKNLELTCRNNIRRVSEQLKNVLAEFSEYQNELDAYDQYSVRIRNELNKI